MSQVQKWGNSLGIRIPKELVMEVGLEDLLSKITPDNIHSEVQTGESQGRESR
jgi:antitoxin MazE